MAIYAMRIPYFISFYSSVILVLGGLACQDPRAETYGWASVLMAMAVVLILVGVVDVVAVHRRGTGGV